MTMVQIGDIHITRLLECTYWTDPGGPFGLVPRALWNREFPVSPDNLVKHANHCLLVKTGGQNILIDTGYGDHVPAKVASNIHLSHPEGTLIEGLARHDLTPADIHLVINTHLHGDHCSGNMTLDEQGELIPAYPNAEYVVQRREYDDAMQPNERTRATYLPQNYQPLVESGQMRLLDGDTDIVPGIRGVVTPGHTPGHMSIVFESQGQWGLHACDMATYAVHMERLGWMTAYDVEPLITLETKRHWQQWALEHDALIFFPHDPYRPVGRLREGEGGRFQLEPVASSGS